MAKIHDSGTVIHHVRIHSQFTENHLSGLRHLIPREHTAVCLYPLHEETTAGIPTKYNIHVHVMPMDHQNSLRALPSC